MSNAARGFGIPFDGETGANNSITDVDGVLVGQADSRHDAKGNYLGGQQNLNTGVTAVLPLGNGTDGIDTLVFAGVHRFNGNGEMTGTAFIEESGFLEGPILLTNTVSVGTVRDAVISYAIAQAFGKKAKPPLNPDDMSLYLPVVAETYDGYLNDILSFGVTPDMVKQAIDGANPGDVAEGNVGAGTGTTCYSWKGGIGTASRLACVASGGGNKQIKNVSYKDGKFRVGVLVQANNGMYWDLVVLGVPVGRYMRPLHSPDCPPSACKPSGKAPLRGSRHGPRKKSSIIVVIATDAPLLPDQLKRLARRAALGVARTGTIGNNDSGDLFIAFSTQTPTNAKKPPRNGFDDEDHILAVNAIPNFDSMDGLFDTTVQATEEAIVNALISAQDLEGLLLPAVADRDPSIGCAITGTMQGTNYTMEAVMKMFNRWKDQ